MAGLIPKGPWTSSSTAKPAQKHDEESLLTVLPTPADRAALTILVADCTELMRQGLLDTFDASNTGATIEQLDSPDDVAGDVEDKLVLTPEVDVLQQDDAKTTQKQKEAAQKKALERRQKELAGPKMQELKSAALTHFDEWRSAVIQRVGEIVNSRATAEQQKDEAKPSEQQKPAKAESSAVKIHEPAVYDDSVTRLLVSLYSPVATDLTRLTEAKRALVLHSVLLLLLSLENYASYSRVLLLRLTTSLNLPIKFLAEDERTVASGLLAAAENMHADEETKKAAEGNKDSRTWKVGLATVAGAALIGITGGLAAPLLAAGIGSVMGGLGLGATAAAGYLGTLAGSSVLVGGLFGAYGGRMTGKMMDQYAKEVEDFGFVPVRTSPSQKAAQALNPLKNEADSQAQGVDKDLRRLRVAIGVSGWLNNEQEVVAPWHVVGVGLETFALRWELDSLMGLGNALTSMITSAAWGFAKSEIIKRTVFSALYAGLWPLALLKASRVIDNPWSVAHYRAVKTGEVLADALINKAQGERPVTLIGYSLGAKVIYTCLQRLADRKAFGLVESVVLIGAPTPSDTADWRAIRAVVAGRVVNAFSTKDYILAFLYRSSSIQLGVAGLQAIQGVAGVENVDVSELVSGHTAYRFLTGTILRKLGFEDVESAELEKEQQALHEEEARQEKEKEAATDGELTDEAAEKNAKKLEAEVEQKNQRLARSKSQAESGKGEKSVIDHARTQNISSQ